MKQKKMKTALIIGMMLVCLSLATVYNVAAAGPKSIYGTLYIDDVIAPAGINLKIEIGGEVYNSATLVWNVYNYILGTAPGHEGETGYLYVFYDGQWMVPVDNQSILIGNVTDYILDLHIDTTANNPPYVPSNPSPSNGQTGVSVSAGLSWTGGDPDGDPVTYDVYFGSSSPPSSVSTGQAVTTYTPSLAQNTVYYWQIVAWDDNGASATGPIWSFTTGAPAPPPNPPPYTPPGGSTNSAPNADASNSETTGIVGVSVTFDGSLSSDSDGSIVNYTWNFGDGTKGYSWITTHVFDDAITYDVTLTVTDDDGSTDDDTIQVVISAQANIPPRDPVVTGTGIGTKNTDYSYTAVSTDDDNDTIQYVFNWGDAQTTTTDFLDNGTATVQMHNWSSAGVYTIGVRAYDNETYSGTTSYVVLIDAWWVKNIGYLLDNDPDGVYDVFHSNATGEETDVEQLENGSYLIDDDGDGVWDYGYDKETDTLWVYSEATEDDYTLWYMLLLGVIIVIIVLIIIAMAMRRSKDKSKQQKKTKKK